MFGISSERLRAKRLSIFLISLLLLMGLYPWLESGGINSTVLNLFFTIVFLTAVYVASSSQRRFLTAICLFVPALVFNWLNTVTANTIVALTSHILRVAFFAFIALLVLNEVLRAERVTLDVVFGGISVYLMIAFVWSAAYVFLETLEPGSFHINAAYNADGIVNQSDFTYYSFVTLTTLGYGEIIPVTSRARSLAALEAVIGPVYLAVLIARLVATYVGHEGKA